MSAEHNNFNPDLEKYLNNLVADVTDGNEEVGEDVKNELRSHLQSLVDDFMSEGISEGDAIKKAILTFGDSNIISRSLSTTLNRKTWLAQALIQHLCLWIFFSIIFRDLNAQFDIPFINYFAALIPTGISFLFSIMPSIAITSEGIKLKTKFGKTTHIPLDEIKSIEYEKGHLFGKRNIVIVLNNDKKHTVSSTLWGMKTSIKYLVSKRPEIIPQEILEYVTKIRNVRTKERRWLSILFSAFLFILSGIVVYGTYQYHKYGILPLYFFLTISVFFIIMFSILNAVDLRKSIVLCILIFLNAWHGGVAAYLIFSYNQGLTNCAGYSAIILFISALVIYLPKLTKKQLAIITTGLCISLACWYGAFNYIVYPERANYEFIEKKEFTNGFVWGFKSHEEGNTISCHYTASNSNSLTDKEFYYAASLISVQDNTPTVKTTKLPAEMTFNNCIPYINPAEYLLFASKDNPARDTLPYPEREEVPLSLYYYTVITPSTKTLHLDDFKQLPEFSWATGFQAHISTDGRYLYTLFFSYNKETKTHYAVYDMVDEQLLYPENKNVKSLVSG